MLKDLPVDLQNAHPERHTIVNYEGTDKSYKIDDVWANRSAAHRALGCKWTGEAHFMVKPEGTDNVPMKAHAEAQGHEEMRPHNT